MTLKQATITGYQSHKKTVLNFHAGVNVVIGKTDAGKSAIFRALGWPITNRNGDRSFRSRLGGKTDVELVFADRKEISRVQDKHNEYYLFDPVNNVDEEYKAFKSDIPEDIVAALNMSSLNIQSQFDPPFLLADSSGDVAKVLNKVANLTDIDVSIGNIRKYVLANSREINILEEQIILLEEQKAFFDYLVQMEKDIVQYECFESQYKNISQDDFNLALLITEINKQQEELNEIEAFLKAEELLALALALVAQLNTVTGQVIAIETLITQTETNTNTLAGLNKFLEVEYRYVTIMVDVITLQELEFEISDLNRLVNKVLANEDQIRTHDKNLVAWETKFNALMPMQCPLCGK